MTERSLPLREPLLTRGRRPAAMLAAGTLLFSSAVLGFAGQLANASSHREAPLIAGDPAVDNTDVYAFASPENDGSVTLIANWIPFEDPNGGPNFYPWAEDAFYDINIDNDGDAVADITYRWQFFNEDLRGTDTFLYNNGPVETLNDENLLFHQYYSLRKLDVDAGTSTELLRPGGADPDPAVDAARDAPETAPSYTGDTSMGGEAGYNNLREDAIEATNDGGLTVATQADDPFFLDLRVFDLLYGMDLSEIGQDSLACYNVNSLVLTVPQENVAIGGDAVGNPAIGVWSTTSRAPVRNADGSADGAISDANEVQVSRLGNPLVNEVVVPSGLKDAFNSIDPVMDAAALDAANPAGRILSPEVPKLIEAIYGIPAPATPRFDIFEVFLTGVVTNAVVDVDKDPATLNPLDIDLNSQAINADADPALFQPSEMLRLNMSIPPTPAAAQNRLGLVGGDLDGFPNGRRLADDVLDIELLVLEGITDVNNIPADRAVAAPLLGGDAVNANDKAFSETFPYLALPNTQSVNTCGGDGPNPPPGNPPPGNPPPGNPPPANPPAANPPAANPPVGMPRGGVETGIGGLAMGSGWVPALTGSAALLLVGAGAGSLMYRRKVSALASAPSGGQS